MQDNSGIFSVNKKSDAIFKAAKHHSWRVRILKVGLPIIAIAIAVVFSWFTFFATQGSSNVVIINSDEGSDGKLTMTEPKLEGYTKANKPYSMTALKAIQDPSRSGVIELLGIIAKLPMGDRGEASVDAKGGIYDNVNGRLVLNKPFNVKTNDGLVAKLKSANVNLSTSELETNEPIDIKRGGQYLKANSLKIQDNGQLLLFKGNVSLVIDNTIEQ